MAGRKGRKGNGEGNIRQRSDGRWEGRLALPNGRSKSLYGRTRAEVARRLAAAIRDRDHGMVVALDERQTVGQYLAAWLETIRPTVKPRTHQRYELAVRVHLIPALGGVRLARLSAQQVQGLYAAKLTAGLAPATVAHLHAVLHRALRAAERLTLVARNVAELVSAPRPQEHEMHVLTFEQAQQFLEAARGDPLEALYALALTTGMRQGELLALQWEDVDLDGRVIHVRHTLQHGSAGTWTLGTPKTAKSRREVELNPSTVEALRAHRTAQLEARLAAGPLWQDHGLVFTRGDGEPMRGTHLLQRHFHPFLKRAGLPMIRFHDLRHTAATQLLLLGINSKVVQERLGHSNVGITLDRYSHVLPGMQRDAALAMERLFEREGSEASEASRDRVAGEK